jgi:hypothetical protein
MATEPGSAGARPPDAVPSDQASPARCIDLRLNEISQLFQSLDPSPFREKDLDAQAEEFIVDWARELPRTAPLVLTIHLTKQPAMPDAPRAVAEAVRNYFTYRAEQTASQHRELLRQAWKNLGIGLVFLSTCLLSAEFLEVLGDATFVSVIRESLIIGGWVAMWRPMEMFLYDRWPLLRRQALCQQPSRMTVSLDVKE